jgi:hypothetical protein
MVREEEKQYVRYFILRIGILKEPLEEQTDRNVKNVILEVAYVRNNVRKFSSKKAKYLGLLNTIVDYYQG